MSYPACRTFHEFAMRPVARTSTTSDIGAQKGYWVSQGFCGTRVDRTPLAREREAYTRRGIHWNQKRVSARAAACLGALVQGSLACDENHGHGPFSLLSKEVRRALRRLEHSQV